MPAAKPLAVGFWEKVVKSDGCWRWSGAHNNKGRANLRGRSAPRIAWEICIGPVPRELSVCHHCDNPGCVNPDHLFLGTHTDNMQDMVKKGRKKRLAAETAANRKLDWVKVRQIRALREIGLTCATLATLFYVGKSQVKRIVSGKHWVDAG